MSFVKNTLLAYLIILPEVLVGQVFKGQASDSRNNTPLPYASIGVKGKSVGGIADIKGNFQIDMSRAAPTDTIVVSYLGYKSVLFVKQGIKSLNYEIKLTPITYQLTEVVAYGKRETIIIGNKRASGQFTGWGDYSSSKGRLRGLAIETDETPLKLARFVLHLNECEFDSVRFRLHIFPLFANHSGDMNQELIHENIFFTAYKDQKKVSVNLIPYNLVINQGIIVAVEWVDAWAPPQMAKKSYLLTISLSREDGYSYTRETAEEAFSVAQTKLTPTMHFEAFKPGKIE